MNLHPTGETITGTTDDDVLVSTAGADAFDGNGGFDLVSYADAAGPVQIDLTDFSPEAGEAAGDTYANIDGFILSNSADQIDIGDTGGYVEGLDGIDVFAGGAGNDTLAFTQSTGSVQVDLSSGSVADDGFGKVDVFTNESANNSTFENVIGSANGDTITGDGDVNQLFGGDGDDVITGGLGADILDGGAGDDVFVFDAAALTDAVDNGLYDDITDYTFGSDIIDLQFLNIGGGDLSDFVWLDDSSGTHVEVVVDSDGVAGGEVTIASLSADVVAVMVQYDETGTTDQQSTITV